MSMFLNRSKDPVVQLAIETANASEDCGLVGLTSGEYGSIDKRVQVAVSEYLKGQDENNKPRRGFEIDTATRASIKSEIGRLMFPEEPYKARAGAAYASLLMKDYEWIIRRSPVYKRLQESLKPKPSVPTTTQT